MIGRASIFVLLICYCFATGKLKKDASDNDDEVDIKEEPEKSDDEIEFYILAHPDFDELKILRTRIPEKRNIAYSEGKNKNEIEENKHQRGSAKKDEDKDDKEPKMSFGTLKDVDEFYNLKKSIIDSLITKTDPAPIEPRIDAESEISEQNDYYGLSNSENLSSDEITANNLYQKGVEMLNSGRTSRKEAIKLLMDASSFGHLQARVLIAYEQLFGTELDQDIAAAKETFEKLADLGVVDAHMGLGFLYATGIGVTPSQSKALVHYLFGALGGSSWAQMALGYRYLLGITLNQDCEHAVSFYRQVASKVAKDVRITGGYVVHRIRLVDEADNPSYSSGIMDHDLIDYYQMLADKGDVQAQVGLGQLYYQGGRGVPLDFQKALQYFLLAADAGSPMAIAYLGKMHLEGNEFVKQDNNTALKFFQKAADMGSPVGQNGLGMIYLYGNGVKRDYKKAFHYFKQAAEQGWVDGQLHLGVMYYGGLGVKRDFKEANKLFTLASQSGNVLAFYNLAQMHMSGTGVMRSCSTAVELYKNVAERGRWSAFLMDAHNSYHSGALNQSFVKYAFLAELGYEVAQSNAAFILDTVGEQIWTNKSEAHYRAMMYLSRSGSQNYSPSLVRLGDYYYYGLGTKIDYEMAVMYYRIAFEQHRNAQAVFNLGYMHEVGLGLAQDIYLAKRCYDIAYELSENAQLPAMLALIKLSLFFVLKYFQEKKFLDIFRMISLDQIFGSYWDIYLMAFLALVVSYRYYRPVPPPPDNARPPVQGDN